MTKIFIVIPCFNPTTAQWINLESYLKGFITKVRAEVKILIVDDGSSKWIEPPTSFSEIFEIYKSPINKGKGAAIRLGAERMPKGMDILAFTDFDAPFQIDDLIGVCSGVLAGSQVCIGDRTTSAHRMSRAISHRIFKLIVRAIFIGGVFDSQAGIKAFSAPAAEFVAKIATLDGFLFDIEWLYIAAHHRLTIQTWPVHLTAEHKSSHLRSFVRWSLVSEFLKLIWRIVKRKYNSQELADWMAKKRNNDLLFLEGKSK